MLRLAITGTILAGVALFTDSPTTADAAEEAVTFQHDVLPILAKYCHNCHRPGQVAPMSFLTYETTRPWATQIKAMVTAKKMPPLVGSPHYTVLTRGEGLTQTEIETLVTWVDHGAPEGTARAPSESSNRFAWVPAYPGARLENIRTVQNRDQRGYGYHFQVKDESAKVRKFYESNLKSAGFTVIGKSGANGKSWDLYAENPDRTRSIDVNGNAQPEGVNVGVIAVVR